MFYLAKPSADSIKQQVELLSKQLQLNCEMDQLEMISLLKPLIKQLVEWVAFMPASQANHHRQSYGLLLHSLEVAINLTNYAGLYLKPHHSLFNQLTHPLLHRQLSQRKAWLFLGAVIGIMHDLGKLFTDYQISNNTEHNVNQFDPTIDRLLPWLIAQGNNLQLNLVWNKGRKGRHDLFTSKLIEDFLPHNCRNYLELNIPQWQEICQLAFSREKNKSLFSKLLLEADSASARNFHLGKAYGGHGAFSSDKSEIPDSPSDKSSHQQLLVESQRLHLNLYQEISFIELFTTISQTISYLSDDQFDVDWQDFSSWFEFLLSEQLLQLALHSKFYALCFDCWLLIAQQTELIQVTEKSTANLNFSELQQQVATSLKQLLTAYIEQILQDISLDKLLLFSRQLTLTDNIIHLNPLVKGFTCSSTVINQYRPLYDIINYLSTLTPGRVNAWLKRKENITDEKSSIEIRQQLPIYLFQIWYTPVLPWLDWLGFFIQVSEELQKLYPQTFELPLVKGFLQLSLDQLVDILDRQHILPFFANLDLTQHSLKLLLNKFEELLKASETSLSKLWQEEITTYSQSPL